jgi:hypothetical protein
MPHTAATSGALDRGSATPCSDPGRSSPEPEPPFPRPPPWLAPSRRTKTPPTVQIRPIEHRIRRTPVWIRHPPARIRPAAPCCCTPALAATDTSASSEADRLYKPRRRCPRGRRGFLRATQAAVKQGKGGGEPVAAALGLPPVPHGSGAGAWVRRVSSESVLSQGKMPNQWDGWPS